MNFHVIYQSCVTGHNVSFPCPFTNLDTEPFPVKFSDETRLIFMVSIRNRRALERRNIFPYIPDDSGQVRYSFAMSFFNDLLLNKSAFFLPYGGIEGSPVVRAITGDAIFIRPDDGFK